MSSEAVKLSKHRPTADGVVWCSACNEFLDVAMFTPRKRVEGRVVAYATYCRPCMNVYRQKRRAKLGAKPKPQQARTNKSAWEVLVDDRARMDALLARRDAYEQARTGRYAKILAEFPVGSRVWDPATCHQHGNAGEVVGHSKGTGCLIVQRDCDQPGDTITMYAGCVALEVESDARGRGNMAAQ